MSDNFCAECEHFERLQTAERGEGMCRRYPPQMKQNTGPDATSNYFNWIFPIMLPHDYCGEFRKKAKKCPTN